MAKKKTSSSKSKTRVAKKSTIVKRTTKKPEQAVDSDLKISKFAKTLVDNNVQSGVEQSTDTPDDLMKLNQKLNQLFKQSVVKAVDSPDNKATSDEAIKVMSKAKTSKIALEPISAEMIEKSAEAEAGRLKQQASAQSTEELTSVAPAEIEVQADLNKEVVETNDPIIAEDAQGEAEENIVTNKVTVEIGADVEATKQSYEPEHAPEIEQGVVSVKVKAKASSKVVDGAELEGWEDELSDEMAEKLADQLDEIDKQEQAPVLHMDDDEPNLGTIVLTSSEIVESSPASRRARLGLWLSVLAAAILSSLIVWRLMIYQHVSVNGQQFKTESVEQIVRQVIEQIKDRKVGFQLANYPVVELRLGDAGIGVDAERLSEAVNDSRRLTLTNLLFKNDISVSMLVDYPVLQSVLDDHFKEKLIQPTDAKLVYDKKQNLFLISQAREGYRVDARTAVPDANQLLARNNPIVAVAYQASDPLIKEIDLKTAEAYINDRLKLRINLNHDNKLLYFADPWDIADWVELNTHPQTKKVTIDFSKQKIQDFIEKTVSPQIARGVINRKVLVNDQNQVIQILQEGRRGLGAVDPGDSADKIKQALLNNQNLDINLSIKEIDFAEERLLVTGLKWIEVNLTKQTTTLYSGEQPLHSFVISSGVHPWPTPTGTYKVWFKNPIQRMQGGSREAGDYYNLPNVRWNTYFNRDIGFHTAYWHNNFGRPMSHGCINMREADAKVVFDFAPIGTMVVVKR